MVYEKKCCCANCVYFLTFDTEIICRPIYNGGRRFGALPHWTRYGFEFCYKKGVELDKVYDNSCDKFYNRKSDEVPDFSFARACYRDGSQRMVSRSYVSDAIAEVNTNCNKIVNTEFHDYEFVFCIGEKYVDCKELIVNHSQHCAIDEFIEVYRTKYTSHIKFPYNVSVNGISVGDEVIREKMLESQKL